MSTLIPNVSSQIGSLYFSNDDTHLYRFGFHGFEESDHSPESFRRSQGLAEQCYRDGNSNRISDVPSSYFEIHSSLGHATPKEVYIFPIRDRNQVNGVIELASFKNLSKKEIHLLDLLSDTMGPIVTSINASVKTAGLLNKTKEQAEELSAKAKDLELAGRYKSEFLANMTHELRTPMNAVLGYTQLLKRDFKQKDDLAPYVDDLNEVESAGKHLLSLINNILDISKIEAGKVELHVEQFKLKDELDIVTTIARPLAEKNQNRIEFNIDIEDRVMTSDATKIKQVILNLLSNASKFTKNDIIKLNVKAEKFRNRDAVVFEVIDHGIGMSQEQAEKIFDSFTQADSSMTREYGGTGLGLSISKNFVELMEGKIEIESKIDKGSLFRVTLPLTLDAKEKQELRKQPIEVVHEDLLGEFNILIIDDSQKMHDLIKRSLEESGDRIISAHDGQSGISHARKIKPDLILLDLELPDLSGWDVLTILKNDPELSSIPVIMVTISDDRKTAYSLGASDFLQKPIEHDALKNLLLGYKSDRPTHMALVVEDDRKSQNIMKRILNNESWEVEIAENGRVALDFMQDKLPEIIFLDLMMPEMDGFEFLENIKQHEEWSKIPIIIVTAKELTEEDKVKLNGGAKNLLQKGDLDIFQLEQEIVKATNNIRSRKNYVT